MIPCDPVTARISGTSSQFYLIFKASDVIWKFDTLDPAGVASGLNIGTKSVLSYYTDLAGRVPDAEFQFSGSVAFIFGKIILLL